MNSGRCNTNSGGEKIFPPTFLSYDPFTQANQSIFCIFQKSHLLPLRGSVGYRFSQMAQFGFLIW
jgi:hypothetical protein